MPPAVSVVTLTHNKLAVTRRCLASLLATSGPEWELIVVDNGSTDGTPEWLGGFAEQAAGAGVELRVLANARNVGCSTGRNQGLAAAQAPAVVFMDNDVALRSRAWLSGLAQRLAALPEAGIVGPKLLYPYPPHDIQCAGVGISRQGRVQFRGRGQGRADPCFNLEEEVQCLISACFMARTEIVRAAGGFDEAFNPVEFEDFDLCYKVREAGRRCYYVPSVEMYHFESITTQRTASLPNTALVVRHSLLFKKRWRHMFEHEDGPPGDDCRWRPLPPTNFDAVSELPVI